MNPPQQLPHVVGFASGSKEHFLREHRKFLESFETGPGRVQIVPSVWGDVHTTMPAAAAGGAAGSPGFDRELRLLRAQLGELTREVGQLRTAVLSVRDELGVGRRVSSSWLTSLRDVHVELINPIPIVIEDDQAACLVLACGHCCCSRMEKKREANKMTC